MSVMSVTQWKTFAGFGLRFLITGIDLRQVWSSMMMHFGKHAHTYFR
jgi:hypothetical protein